MLKQLSELLNGTAFRPDTVDQTKTIQERFGDRPFIGISFSMSRVKAVTIKLNKKGGASISQPVYEPMGDPKKVSEFITNFAAQARCTDAVVLVSHSWAAGKLDHSFRGSDQERNLLLKEDPREVTHQPTHDESMSHAVVAHPQRNLSILFSYQRDMLVHVLQPLSMTGLNIARVQSGCFSLLNYIVSKQFSDAFTGSDLLIVDENGVLLVIEEDGGWMDLAFKANQSAGTPEGAVPELLNRRPDPSKPLAFASTFETSQFNADRLKDMNPTRDVQVTNLFPDGDTTSPEFLSIVTD